MKLRNLFYIFIIVVCIVAVIFAVYYQFFDNKVAKEKNADVLICDTAGRLHNKKYLMDELIKIAKEQENVQKHIEGHEIVKEIVVPNKIVNIVIK